MDRHRQVVTDSSLVAMMHRHENLFRTCCEINPANDKIHDMSPRSRRALDRVAESLAVALLIAQLIGVLRGPFVADRFFAWSPHDQRVDYTISARTRGVPLDDTRIRQRYGMPATGLHWHGYGDVLRIVEIVESRRAPDDRWDVDVEYSVNLGPTRFWSLGEVIP
jgi:hypothetical protein